MKLVESPSIIFRIHHKPLASELDSCKDYLHVSVVDATFEDHKKLEGQASKQLAASEECKHKSQLEIWDEESKELRTPLMTLSTCIGYNHHINKTKLYCRVSFYSVQHGNVVGFSSKKTGNPLIQYAARLLRHNGGVLSDFDPVRVTVIVDPNMTSMKFHC